MELGAKYPEPGFAKLYPIQSTGSIPTISASALEDYSIYYILLAVLGIALSICAIWIVSVTRAKESDSRIAVKLRAFEKSLFWAKICFAIFALVLLVIAFDLTPVKAPAEYNLVPKSEQFSFLGTYGLFALGIIVLLGMGFKKAFIEQVSNV